jgi:hypothetical protein
MVALVMNSLALMIDMLLITMDDTQVNVTAILLR